jgi:hypothetical protein
MTVDATVSRDAMRRAVIEALAPHGGGLVADVEEGPNSYTGIWGMDVIPHRAGAAHAYVAYDDGDEVSVAFGQTHANLSGKDPYALAAEVENILVGVFAGRITEGGPAGDSFAHVVGAAGDTIRLGAVCLPIPWRLRRHRRTYASYS